jgi:hypothetical protein
MNYSDPGADQYEQNIVHASSNNYIAELQNLELNCKQLSVFLRNAAKKVA